jgi:phosphatidylinositol-3-phosphatase
MLMNSKERLRLRTVVLMAAAGFLFSLAAGTAHAQSAISSSQRSGLGSTQEGVPRLGHVFLIIGENTTYDHLTPTNAPYLMQGFKPQAAWFTEYYAATHWSQANYVALVTGQFTRCQQQDYGAACHQDVENLFHQLDLARLTWKTWLEAGTARCDTGSGGTCTSDTPCPLTGFYTTGNPAILFDNIEGPGGVWSATTPSQECLQNDIPAGDESDPMGFFNQALAAGDVANFNLIIPNGCEDGEGNCAPINNRYTQFDAFLAREVPLIMASPAFGASDAIIVVYDEDERAGGMAAKNGLGQGGHTVCAIVSPMVVPGDYDGIVYHYSLLRTLQDGFGISDYLGHANDVAPINTIWRTNVH